MTIIFSVLWFPSHLTPLTFFCPLSPDFRHNYWTAAVYLWPPDNAGGTLYWQQTFLGVYTELPKVIWECNQPPVLHLPGSVQHWHRPGEWQQYQWGVHCTSNPSTALCGSYSGAYQQPHAQPFLTWLGSQHPHGQWGLQVRLQFRCLSICILRLSIYVISECPVTYT